MHAEIPRITEKQLTEQLLQMQKSSIENHRESQKRRLRELLDQRAAIDIEIAGLRASGVTVGVVN